MSNIIPLMDKDSVRYITKNITPEEAKYVRDIKSTLDDTEATENTSDDIIYLTKILAFVDKFKTLKWVSDNVSYTSQLDSFKWILETYKDDISEYIQSIIGEIKGSDITKLELPISDNPLDIINELKICVNNWFILHQDDIEFEGARHLTSAFLAQIHKYVYLFRLCKISDVNYLKNTEDESEINDEETVLEVEPDKDKIFTIITPETIKF